MQDWIKYGNKKILSVCFDTVAQLVPNIMSLQTRDVYFIWTTIIDDADKTCRRKKGYPENFDSNIIIIPNPSFCTIP